jgi:hypothetical protein
MPFFSARPSAVFNVRAKRGLLPFLTRQVLTTGYVAAGYRNTVTWRNVNSINNSTDTTTNHGDLLQFGGSYGAQAQNRNNAYIIGTNGSGTEGWGAFATTSCFNMRNNTTLTRNASMDNAYATSHSMSIYETNLDGNYTYAYLTGGNAANNIIRRFNMVTEALDTVTSYSTSYPNVNDDTGNGSSALMHETFGVWYNGTNQVKFTYATAAQANTSAMPGAHAQQRGMSTKLGVGYAGNEGSYNGGNYLRKTNLLTDSTVSTTSIAKPHQNCGEENMTMGQAHQYMLGMYNGAQLNSSWRFNYSTDSGFQLGASGQPSGTASGTGVGGANHPEATIQGRSSGMCFWRD